jgi:hypothetical protein
MAEAVGADTSTTTGREVRFIPQQFRETFMILFRSLLQDEIDKEAARN